MNTLTLLAVDEPQTASREDGFLLESFDNGSMKKLIVATVIPPIDAHINYGAFLRNLHLENGEQNEQFLRKATSFVNVLNIVAAIEETPLPFPFERLQQILGVGYPIQI